MTPNKRLHAPSNPWVFFSAIVALAIAANQAKSEIAQSPAVAALEASMVAWRQKIDFKSTYKYRHGLAGSLADGLAGNWGSRAATPQDEDSATGVYHKMGDLCRLSIRWSRAPIVDSSGSVTYMPVDGICSRFLSITYSPENHTCIVSARPPHLVGVPEPGPHGWGYIQTPLELMVGRETTLLDEFRQSMVSLVESPIQVTSNEAEESTTVQMTFTDAATQATYVKSIEFWTKPAIPVVRRITLKSESKDRHHESLTEFRNYFTTEKGAMPRAYAHAAGPVTTSKGTGWLSMEWQSDDIGDAAPTIDDFTMNLPEGVTPRGWRMANRSSGVMDDTRINLVDLEAEYDISGQTAPKLATNRTGWYRTPFFILIVAIVIIVPIAYLTRRIQ